MKNEIKLNDIKNQYVLRALSGVPYRFKVFTDAGKFQRSLRAKNTRISYVNSLLQLTESDVLLLGGGLRAVAMNLTLTFLLPIPNEVYDENGEITDFQFVEEFRNALYGVFATSEKIQLTAEGKTFVGGVSTTFPTVGELSQRQIVGQSIEYICYIEIAYLANALNSSDVKFYLDGDTVAIPYTTYSITRESTLSANTFSQNVNGEGKTYAENTVLGIDISLPAIEPSSSPTANLLYLFLMGKVNPNTPHNLLIEYGGERNETIQVIFGKVKDGGEGVSNVSRTISFVPYLETEDE